MRLRICQTFHVTLMFIVSVFFEFHGNYASFYQAPMHEVASTSQDIKKVSYCTILDKPEQFDKQKIRTEAILVQNKEALVDGGEAYFYSLSCNRKDKVSFVEYDQAYDLNTTKWEALRKVIDQDKNSKLGRAKVEVVAQFELAKNGGFGHLDAFQFKFHIFEVERINSVPESSAYPKKR